ncbi:MAG: Trk system potassium transporter TrkA [Pseudomonadota bacterium]
MIIKSRLDLRAVVGPASHPDILRRAGADDADLLIACTSADEVNMMACQIAYTVFQTPTKIARVRSPAYRNVEALFHSEHIPVDYLISPEQLVTLHIERLIELPGALQAIDFAEGRLRLIGVRAESGGRVVGHKLRTLREHLPDVDSRVVAIYRGDHAIIPTGDTVVEAGDEVFFLAARRHAAAVMEEMRAAAQPNRHVMVAGGGNIGYQLALRLQHHYRVKLIERNPERAEFLAGELDCMVLQGDAADVDLIVEENIQDMDVFCALTNDDEANILSAILAKDRGAGKVMSLVNRVAYSELIPTSMIDVAVSPHQITIGQLLTHVRRGNVEAVHSLRRGVAEVIEAIATGDRKTSRLVGRQIGEVDLPLNSTIGALVRGEAVLMAHHDSVIEAGDHIIFFVTDKRRIPEIERLCQVKATFI